MTNENPRTIGCSVGCYKHSRFYFRLRKRINLLVLQVNDLVLLEVNAEITKMTICRISGHFFHENFTDFDRVFGVFDENGTYYDQESYVLDPKLSLTCNALRRKVPILYRIGKKYSAGKKIPSALRVKVRGGKKIKIKITKKIFLFNLKHIWIGGKKITKIV